MHLVIKQSGSRGSKSARAIQLITIVPSTNLQEQSTYEPGKLHKHMHIIPRELLYCAAEWDPHITGWGTDVAMFHSRQNLSNHGFSRIWIAARRVYPSRCSKPRQPCCWYGAAACSHVICYGVVWHRAAACSHVWYGVLWCGMVTSGNL